MNKTLTTSKTKNDLRLQAIFLLGFLVIEYALGMVTNLFEQFPDTNQADQLWAFARSQFPILAHIVVGTLLLVGAIVLLVRAVRQNSRPWIVSSVVGLIGILAAFFGGSLFVTTQVDGYSLVMALATILAFLAYGWGLYADRGSLGR